MKLFENIRGNRPKVSVFLVVTFCLIFAGAGVYLTYLSFSGNGSELGGIASQPKEKKINILTTQVIQDIKQKKNDAISIKNAKARKDEMLNLIETNPTDFLSAALSEDVTKYVKKNAQRYLEKKVVIEGEYIQIIEDDFENNQSEIIHQIENQDGKTYQIIPANEDFISPSPSSKIKISGYLLDNYIVPENTEAPGITVVSENAENQKAVAGVTTPVVRKMAVIMFTRAEIDPAPAYTPAELNESLKEVQAYYKEVSYNKFLVQGKSAQQIDIFGPYLTSKDTCTGGTVSLGWCTTEAHAAAIEAGVDLSGYDYIMYNNARYKTGGGAANMSKLTFVMGGMQSRTIAHELGHLVLFTTEDSLLYECTDASGNFVQISDECKYSTYGDLYSIMGLTNSIKNHFPAFNRARNSWYRERETLKAENMGWIPETNITTATTNGTYTIAPANFETTKKQLIVVPRDKNLSGVIGSYISFEYRQPSPYDQLDPAVKSGTNKFGGVLVHLHSRNTTLFPHPPAANSVGRSYLLDTTPGLRTPGDGTEPLTLNQTFSDSRIGLVATLTSLNSLEATIKVEFKPIQCVNSKPSIHSFNSTKTGAPGTSIRYNFSFINNDNAACAPRKFVFLPIKTDDPDSTWSFSPEPIEFTASPGEHVSGSVTITSGLSNPDGQYTFNLQSVDNPGALMQYGYTVFTPPPTETPTDPPTSDPPATEPPTSDPPATEPPQTDTGDNNPPIITTSGIVDGQVLGNKGSASLTVNASDPSGIASIKIYINSTLVQTCNDVTTCVWTISNLRKFPNGTYSAKIVVTDKDQSPKTSISYVNFTKGSTTTETKSPPGKKK